MVVIDPNTGDILAMVGSYDYNATDNPKIDGNVNVTISPRQMGSSVKPYTYLTAFHQGYGPWLETPDIRELNFGAYKLLNWDERYLGPMTARQALIQSRNIPAVYTLQEVGIDNFIETAETLGISTLTDRNSYGLSLTLGTGDMKLLEHLEAFTVFANEGVKRDARAILEVKDSSGEVLKKKEDNKGKRVWDEKEIYALNWIMCDLGGFGDQPNNQYYFYNGRRTYCGKTGTNNGPTDLVSMLYHKNLAVAVWAGNNDNTPSPGGWSTTIPLPIASSFMTRMAGRYKPETFTRPSGIVATSVCNDTGAIAGKNSECKKVPSIYIAGKAPKPDKRETFYVCKVEDLIPTDVTFARANGLATKAVLLDKELENSIQQANYERYLENTKGVKYFFEKPGTGECTLPLGSGNAPSVQITAPADGASIGRGETVTISAYANAKESVTSVDFYFDNVLIQSDSSAPYSVDYTVANDEDLGGHGIKAVVTDNKGKSTTDSISVNVTSDSVSVSMSSPSNFDNINTSSFPYTLQANTTGSGITAVRFLVDGTVVGVADTDGSNGWSATWSSATSGAHSIKAIATKGGIDYESSPITVTVL
jgi:membrane peptidoglycan carboxypeptidase